MSLNVENWKMGFCKIATKSKVVTKSSLNRDCTVPTSKSNQTQKQQKKSPQQMPLCL